MNPVTVFYAPSREDSGQSRALLYRAAQCHTGLTWEELGALEVNPFGKPSFPRHPALHFSVTHSGQWWMCAFSSQPVGLDLQIHRSHTPPAALSRRFFHPAEDRFLARENYRLFFDLWSAKESWVKYLGKGFFEDPETFSVVAPDGAFPAMPGVHLQQIPFRSGYSLCLCTREPAHPRLFPLPEPKTGQP